VLVPAETAQAGSIGQVSEGLTWQRDPIAVRSTCQLASRLISKKTWRVCTPTQHPPQMTDQECLRQRGWWGASRDWFQGVVRAKHRCAKDV